MDVYTPMVEAWEREARIEKNDRAFENIRLFGF
jgi:hypothetical protein